MKEFSTEVAAENRYEFKVDGKVYSLPSFAYIPGETVESVINDNVSDLGAVFQLFRAAADEETAKVIVSLPLVQFSELAKDWEEQGAVSLGKSVS